MRGSTGSRTTSLARLKKRWMNHGLFGILILVNIFLYSLAYVEMNLVFDPLFEQMRISVVTCVC